MALVLESALKNVLADAIDTDIGTAGYMEFQTSGDAEVATITFQNPAFGSAAGGIITLAGVPLSDTSATGGTVAQFSIFASGAVKKMEGVVQVSGADLDLSSLVVGVGDTVELTAFTITVP